jgi:hypothetical protein
VVELFERDLGPAIAVLSQLLHSRRAGADHRELGRYEVPVDQDEQEDEKEKKYGRHRVTEARFGAPVLRPGRVGAPLPSGEHRAWYFEVGRRQSLGDVARLAAPPRGSCAAGGRSK